MDQTPSPPRPNRGVPQELLGEVVAVDTDSPYLYLGLLEGADGEYLRLGRVDVHETLPAGLSKERYTHEAGGLGVRENRACVYVRLARVVSLSRLKDVLRF